MSLITPIAIAAPPRCRTISDLYVHSPSAAPCLRVGVALDSSRPSRAVADILHDLLRADFLDVVLVIYVISAKNTHADSTLLWRTYMRVDKWGLSGYEDPFEIENCRTILDQIDSLSVDPTDIRCFQDVFATIRSKRLDVLLNLATTHSIDSTFDIATYGVWSYSHSFEGHLQHESPYCDALLAGNPLSVTTLQASRGVCDPPRALAQAFFATHDGTSLLLNQIQPYWSSTHLVIQKLWELHTNGWEFIESRMPTMPLERRYDTIHAHVRKNTRLFCWLVPRVAKKACERIARVATGVKHVLHWRIAVRVGGHYIQGPNGLPDTEGFKWVESPDGHFYADPFVFSHEGRHWLFFEDYNYRNRRGEIACSEVYADGTIGDPQLALSSPFHMSYPYVFGDNDEIFMIPETVEAESVRLYKCERFPDRWAPVKELFHGPAVDTSICKEDDVWWFFTSLRDPRAHGIVLYLFFSEDLTGQWHYHPANPISFDVRNARGAGRIFRESGKLIRPSQDSTYRYGHAFSLNEIVKLSPTDYQEHLILSVGPSCFPGLMSTHTYNRFGTVEAVDGQILRNCSGL